MVGVNNELDFKTSFYVQSKYIETLAGRIRVRILKNYFRISRLSVSDKQM